MRVSKTHEGDIEVVFEPGEVSFVPEVGRGIIAIKFGQGIGDFFRNLGVEEKQTVGTAIGMALVGAVEGATSRIVRSNEGMLAQLPAKIGSN